MDAPPPIHHGDLVAQKRLAVEKLRAVLDQEATAYIRSAFEDLETLLTVCAQEGVPISADEDALYARAREHLAH
jgi:hypothetical protein